MTTVVIGDGKRSLICLRLGSRTLDPMAWAFHVAFSGVRTGAEILEDEFLGHVRAPFEKTLSHCLQQGGDFRIAQ